MYKYPENAQVAIFKKSSLGSMNCIVNVWHDTDTQELYIEANGNLVVLEEGTLEQASIELAEKLLPKLGTHSTAYNTLKDLHRVLNNSPSDDWITEMHTMGYVVMAQVINNHERESLIDNRKPPEEPKRKSVLGMLIPNNHLTEPSKGTEIIYPDVLSNKGISFDTWTGDFRMERLLRAKAVYPNTKEGIEAAYQHYAAWMQLCLNRKETEESPYMGRTYAFADPLSTDYVEIDKWNNDDFQQSLLNRGAIYPNTTEGREAAKQHAINWWLKVPEEVSQ